MVEISQRVLNMGAKFQIMVNNIIENSIEFSKRRERQVKIVAANSPSLREATVAFK
jgi:hypothetical protein